MAEQKAGLTVDQGAAAVEPQRFRTQNMFSTPLVASNFGNEKLLSALERVILKRRDEDPGITRSNRGGWHSDIRILDWGGEPARVLARQIVEFANANTMKADGSSGQLTWAVEGWANVNEQGQSNTRHVHGGCFWSAVYYVRVPPGEGGNIVFYDPRMPMIAMHAPRLRFRNTGGERLIRLKPQPGRMLIFPSWLDHEVEPWQGEGQRISIALNLLAKPDAAPPPATNQAVPAAQSAQIADASKPVKEPQ